MDVPAVFDPLLDRRIVGFARAQAAERVAMPLSGEFTLLDVLAYHHGNASYHEGQIGRLKALAEARV